MPSSASTSAPALQRELRAAGLRVVQADAHARDFGGQHTCVPLAAVAVTSETEIVAALAVARRAQVPVALRGAGHSCGGQALGPGLVLCLSPGPAAATDAPGQGGTWTVWAGARWLQVEAGLAAAGRTFPVLTDYLDLSVGGTLSVGGYGVRSIARGAQVNHVRALRLVSCAGTTVRCSPAENPALFAHALAGQRPVGVIAAVELAPVPRPAACDHFDVAHAGLGEAAGALAAVSRHGSSDGAVGPDSFFAVREPELPGARSVWGFDRRPDLNAPRWPPVPALAGARLTAREVAGDPALRTHRRRAALLAAFPGHLHLWQDFVVEIASAQRLAAVADRLLDRLGADARGPARGAVATGYMLGIRKRAADFLFPFEPAPGGREASFAGLGLYFFVPADAAPARARATEDLTQFQAEALALGARPYRYGALPMRDPRRVYGDAAVEADARLRDAVDPNRLLCGRGIDAAEI